MTMKVLVGYASRHGATKGIAEAIGARLDRDGHETDVRRVEDLADLRGYDAFVLGAAIYATHWMKEAVQFVREHRDELDGRPVWLFASGPLGSDRVDAEGHDLTEVANPKEYDELAALVHARGHKVFFGALDPEKLSMTGRALRKLPAARQMLPEGDFRDWSDVDHWAHEVAEELGRIGSTPPG